MKKKKMSNEQLDLLHNMFNNILSRKYTHITEETASYDYEVFNGTLYIYFEWSNGKTDWINNFDFPAKPYRDMKNKWYAHRGFLKVWKTIEDNATELIEIIKSPETKEIVIMGYSHGAAIAALCHEYCMFNRADLATNGRISGYGFGAPRVVWGYLDKAVKARFNNFTVIRNKKDIVTHVPPAIFGFKHIGEMVTIGAGKWNCVDAHRPENYIKALNKQEE